MKTSILLNSSPATGPHLDQAVRDRLDDSGLVYAEHPDGSHGGAVHTEAVTAS